MTYSELTAAGVKLLTEAGFDEARTDVRVLVSYVCHKDFMALLRDGGEQVPKEQEEQLFYMFSERKNHVPVQYLTGEQEFCGLNFSVRPGALIPRPETELLAEEVFSTCEGKRVLDMCTGSGCIAVTVAKLGKPLLVAASDYSLDALAIAKENAKRLGAEVTFFHGDLFEHVDGRYDMIVSNPPYIKSEVVDSLMPEVKNFEPRMALDGTEDGLLFYRRIGKEAKTYLVPQGRVLFEIGHDQGEEVSDILAKEGYIEIEVKKDYAGLDRFVFAVWPGDKEI